MAKSCKACYKDQVCRDGPRCTLTMKCDSCRFAGVEYFWTSCLLRDRQLCSLFAKGCDIYKPMEGEIVDLITFVDLNQKWFVNEVQKLEILLNSYF